TFDFSGHWRNELSSYMDLTVDGSNNVTGKYVSAVTGTGGPTPSTDVRGNGDRRPDCLYGKLGFSDHNVGWPRGF
ncbi:MAG: hypothetical protein DMG97_34465, partial [Acidobacteria bacterium]